MYRRVFLIVLDGVGIGGASDAEHFGDAGSDTLAHVAAAVQIELPTLARLGLGNLYPDGLPGLPRADVPLAHHARLTEVSAGKDTTTGHWELMGVARDKPSPTFPAGFPPEFIAQLELATGRGVLANHPASGTQVIADYGAEHLRTGKLIVYTSADSVLQIAAHVAVVPVSELYLVCQAARRLAAGAVAVDRVIARPFAGTPEAGFTRTPDRRDYSLPPPGPTYLDALQEAGRDVLGVGKISDIFAERGLSGSHPGHGNVELMATVNQLAQRDFYGLLFVNLVDFDMLYGHRNDPSGMAAALNEFDAWLADFLKARTWQSSDLLIITADHGNDPTTTSTDHSREQVPVLVYSNLIRDGGGRRLAPLPGFFHVGATCAGALRVNAPLPGKALL